MIGWVITTIGIYCLLGPAGFEAYVVVGWMMAKDLKYVTL